MNGHLPPPISRLRRLAPWSADQDRAALRLLAALALSCLLHAGLIFLPYLGESARESRLAQKSRQTLPQVINATLAMSGEHAFSAANVPPRSVSIADAPATDRSADEPPPPARHRAEGVDLLPIPAPQYYTTDQLTKRPQPVTAADLDPPEIRRLSASGKMVLKLWINEFGVVTDVVLEKSELPEVFSRNAIAAFKGMRFAPGERNGRAVGTLMTIEVTYEDDRQPGR